MTDTERDAVPATVSATEPEDFDTLASAFYDETHVMAPGKDIAAAMGGEYDAYDLRVKLYREWLKTRTLRARIAALETDAALLNWLEQAANEAIEIESFVGLDNPADDRVFITDIHSNTRLSQGNTLRAALTAARGGG